MNRLLWFCCLTLLVISFVEADFHFPVSNAGNQFTFVGSAGFEATPNRLRVAVEQFAVNGATYFGVKQSVDRSFSITFTYGFEWFLRGPGDGLALVIQNNASNAVMGLGGSLGYMFANSIALEIDTYQNGESGELSPNSMALHYGGTPTTPNNPLPTFALADEYFLDVSLSTNGQKIKIQLDYDHDAGKFYAFYYDYVKNGKKLAFITDGGYRIEDMLDLDQGKAWIGFTSSTFGAQANAYIYDVQIQPFIAPDSGVVVICPSDLVVTASSQSCTYRGTTGVPTIISLYANPNYVSYSKSPKGPFAPGTYTIVYSATANGGYSFETCSQTVTVLQPKGCGNIL